MVELTVVTTREDRYRNAKVFGAIVFYLLAVTFFSILVRELVSGGTIWSYGAILAGSLVVYLLLAWPLLWVMLSRPVRRRGKVGISPENILIELDDQTADIALNGIGSISLTYRSYMKLRGNSGFGKPSTIAVRGRKEWFYEFDVAVTSKKERKALRKVFEKMGGKVRIDITNDTQATWHKF